MPTILQIGKRGNIKGLICSSINPDVRFGKPCVIGTRIAVTDILIWLASGMSFDDIKEDFPDITQEHILAALSFTAFRE